MSAASTAEIVTVRPEKTTMMKQQLPRPSWRVMTRMNRRAWSPTTGKLCSAGSR